MPTPHVILLAGPNGAGKTTVAPALLQGELQVSEFVNADVIAQGLSAFKPERMAMHAGRVMLQRLQELANAHENFAFETTLAGRHFAQWIKLLKQNNYIFHLIFLWLPSPSVCKKRVADRVSLGGHNIPNDVIERRYYAGLKNFFSLYQPMANSWDFFDNSVYNSPMLIAASSLNNKISVNNPSLWDKIQEQHNVSKEKLR